MKKVEFDYATQALEMDKDKFKINDFITGYSLGKTSLIFNDDDVVVLGIIPIDLVMDIYNEYPNGVNEIYVGRRWNIFNPDDYKGKSSCSRLVIDTIPGLILFVTAMRDYLASKRGLDGTEKKKFYDILGEVTSNLISKYDFSITTSKWMMKNVNAKMYFDTLRKEEYLPVKRKVSEQEYNTNFRNAISGFDNMVNPFMDSECEFLDMPTILQNVDIWVNDASVIGNEYTDNSAILDIRDKNDRNSVFYLRGRSGFSYIINYMLDDKIKIMLKHSFGTCKNGTKGEYIWIEQKDKSTNVTQFDLVYDITNNKIQRNEGKILQATINDKQEVYHYILTATEFAKKLTHDNMLKNKSYVKRNDTF